MKIVLLGGGGHCASCIDVIVRAGREVFGVVDPQAGATPAGTAWLGDDSWLDRASSAGLDFLVTVGQVRIAGTRRRLYEALAIRGYSAATLVSPTAVLGRDAVLGQGTIVMHRAVVNVAARVGNNCIVNTAAVVEHDVVVEDHCHISTGAIVNGAARIGRGSMIGSGAIVLQGVSIAPDVMVGAGAVVAGNIDTPGIWTGVPARRRS